MSPLERPAVAKLEAWSGRPDVKAAEAAVKQHIEEGHEGDPELPELWRDLLPAFEASQHRICGYCAVKVDLGTLDHFRPKAEVTRTIHRPGSEHDDLARIEQSRQLRDAHKPGYWWLAYDTSNFVMACSRCNEAWKRTLFPVRVGDSEHRGPPRRSDEVPLLLNPFDLGEGDVARHFSFDALGDIQGQTAQGRATVATCALWRPSRSELRKKVWDDVVDLCQDLLTPELPPQRHREKLARLVSKGAWTEPFAAVVRAAATASLGREWRSLTEELTGPR